MISTETFPKAAIANPRSSIPMRSLPFRSSALPTLRPLEQPWLPGLAPSPQRHNLFLALPPTDTARATLAQRTAELRDEQDLRGQPLRPDHLHVSLHSLGKHEDARPDLIAAIHELAAKFKSLEEKASSAACQSGARCVATR